MAETADPKPAKNPYFDWTKSVTPNKWLTDLVVPSDWRNTWPFHDPIGREPPKDWMRRLNFVKQSWMDPCQAPFTVYVQTFLPAALRLVLRYYTLDLWDILVNFLRPGGIMSKGVGGAARNLAGGNAKLWSLNALKGIHRRRGKLIGKYVTITGVAPPKGGGAGGLRQFLTDPWGKTGATLGELTGMKGREISAGVARLWVMELKVERFLFWMWMIDLGTDFLWQWTTLLYETSWCKQANGGVCMGTGEHGGAISLAPSPIFVQNIQKCRGPATITTGGIAMSGPGEFSCFFSGTYVNNNDYPVKVTGRIILDGGGRSVAGGNTVIAPGAEGTISMNCNVHGPGTAIGTVITDRGFVGATSTLIYVHKS